MPHTNKGDANEPATKSELEDLAHATARGFAAVDKRFEEVDKRFDRIEATMATKDQLANVLEIVKSIDQQLKEHKTHPDRIKRLERSVFHSQ